MLKEMPVGNYLVSGNKRRITIKNPETTAQEFHDWLKEWWIVSMAAYPVPVTVEEVKDNSPFMAGYYLRVLSGWKIEGLVINGERKDYKSGDLIFLKKSKYTVEISNKNNNNDGKLSPKQIKSWRRVLCGMIGPYALVMPKEQIQVFRDKMQKDADNIKTVEE